MVLHSRQLRCKSKFMTVTKLGYLARKLTVLNEDLEVRHNVGCFCGCLCKPGSAANDLARCDVARHGTVSLCTNLNNASTNFRKPPKKPSHLIKCQLPVRVFPQWYFNSTLLHEQVARILKHSIPTSINGTLSSSGWLYFVSS